jgi:hypothetical protein
MNMRRKVVERHVSAERHAPKMESSLVHRESIGVYVPRPQCDPRSSNSQAQLLRIPNWQGPTSPGGLGKSSEQEPASTRLRPWHSMFFPQQYELYRARSIRPGPTTNPVEHAEQEISFGSLQINHGCMPALIWWKTRTDDFISETCGHPYREMNC